MEWGLENCNVYFCHLHSWKTTWKRGIVRGRRGGRCHPGEAGLHVHAVVSRVQDELLRGWERSGGVVCVLSPRQGKPAQVVPHSG